MLARVERIRSHGGPRVVVLGDSRIAEGFSAKSAAGSLAGSRAAFVNAAVPGSTLRCWSYFLEWMDPHALRGATVIIPLDDYADEDGAWSWQDRELDTRILAARLSLVDLPGYALSFDSFAGGWNALFNGVLKGRPLREDIQALLRSPSERMAKAASVRAHGPEWSDNYEGNPGSLAGLEVNWQSRRIVFPSHVSARQRQALALFFFYQTLPQTGRYRQYRLIWMRRIAAAAARQGARAVVIRVPASPVPLARSLPFRDSAIMQLQKEGVLRVAPADLFAPLEQPQYFFDALHMNQLGRNEFSSRLAAFLAQQPRLGD